VSEAYESLPLYRDARFDALRNSLYHTERAWFLDKLNKSINALVILLGSGVVEKIVTKHSFDELYVELAFLIVATLQLVFDFGGSAKDHYHLQTQYAAALSEMESVAIWDDETERKWSARLVTISGDEVQTMRALDAIAYNQAIDAIHGSTQKQKDFRLYVGPLHYALRHLLTFSRTQFMPESQRPASLFARLFRGRDGPTLPPVG
jgi:hypothetical protein